LPISREASGVGGATLVEVAVRGVIVVDVVVEVAGGEVATY
jgi:hypothetical protein